MSERLFSVTSHVMSEKIDDEVIVIDLTSGTYYSLRDAATAVWDAMSAGCTTEMACVAVEARYDGDRSEIAAAVSAFLDELVAEGLADASPADSGPVPTAARTLEDNRRPFTAPKLEKFTDMQELILLDPVHEVGAAGWPQPAPELK